MSPSSFTTSFSFFPVNSETYSISSLPLIDIEIFSASVTLFALVGFLTGSTCLLKKISDFSAVIFFDFLSSEYLSIAATLP